MKKTLFFAGLFALAACHEAELPDYSLTEGGINFYVAPAYIGDYASYPDDLRLAKEGYDPGSVELGLLAFVPAQPVTAEIMAEIMGRTTEVDRNFALKIVSGDLGVTMDDDYVVPGGEARITMPITIDAAAVAAGETATAVLGFDTTQGDFIAGVDSRETFTISYKKLAGTPMPTEISGFGMDALIDWGMWDFVYVYSYGPISLPKFQFMAAATGKTDLSTVIDAGATLSTCKSKLTEYKALNAVDPVNYPPLYQSGTTWISFP